MLHLRWGSHVAGNFNRTAGGLMDPWFILFPFYGIAEHDTVVAGNDQVEDVGGLAKTEDRSLATQVLSNP